MHRGGPYWLPTRRAPFGRRAGQPSEGAPTDTARSPRASERSASPFASAGRRAHDSRPQQERELRVLRSFPPRGTNRDGSESGTELRIVAAEACGTVFGQTGTDRVGWYACPWRTLFATEWSAARKNPMRAAALHLRATISADVKARRILPSGRRKFPSGNFRSARDLEVAKRVRRGQAQRANPHPSPFARRPYGTPPPPQPLRSVPISVPLPDGPGRDAVDQRRRRDLEPAA